MGKEIIRVKGKQILLKMRSKTNKQKLLIAAASLMACIIVSGSISYYVLYAKDTGTEEQYQEVTVNHGDISIDLTEEGTTQLGTVDQIPEFDPTVVTMTVGEVYVNAGDTVSTGDALFKISEDSYAAAVNYYEQAIEDAKKNVDNASLNYDVGELEAEYEKQCSDSKAAYADEKYAAAIATLDQNVALAKTEYEGATGQIEAYNNAINSNAYYTENQIDEKTQAVTDAQSVVDQAQTAYDQSKAYFDTSKQSFLDRINALSADSETAADDIAAVQNAYTGLVDEESQVSAIKDNLDQTKKDLVLKQSDLSKATENYQKEVDEANQKITQLSDQLDGLKSTYEQALVNAVTQKVDIQNEYNESVMEGQSADTTYATTVGTLESTLNTNQCTLEALQEKQSALLALNDGIICATQDGTIASVNYDVDDTLTADTALVSYYNTSIVMISVEVPQESIAQVTVGDSVDVSVSGVRGKGLTGVVNSISTSATNSGNVSSVTYSVVISLDNSENTLSLGSSAAVTFHFGTISDVNYLPIESVTNISDDTAEVKQYDKDKNVVSVPVTIGEETDSYVVITDGLDEGDTCLMDNGGKQK